jgi:MarR family transcriptional regulator, organic hydroperoxide resistance regulator
LKIVKPARRELSFAKLENRPNVKSPRRQAEKKPLNLRVLKETPGFMLRLLQLQFFEAFYTHFAEIGVTPATYAILVMVRDNPGVGASDIATALRLQLPNLIKLLNELETSGLLKRVRSKTDGRAVELVLTAKGEKLAEQALKMTKPYHQMMLSSLDEVEQRRFIETLNKLMPL